MTITKENWHFEVRKFKRLAVRFVSILSVHKRPEINIAENGQRSKRIVQTIEASHFVVYLSNFFEDSFVNHSTVMLEFSLKIIIFLLLLTAVTLMFDKVDAMYLPVWKKSFMQRPQYAREIKNYAISPPEFISNSNPK